LRLVAEEMERDPLWAPWVKTLFYSAVAGSEDYLAAGLSIDWDEYVGLIPKPVVGVVSPEWAAKHFTKDNIPRGVISLTLTTVYTVMDRSPNEWERELMAANLGYDEWAVAAVILGLNCMHPAVLSWLVERHLHWLPLNKWKDDLKPLLDSLRRCPYLVGVPLPQQEVYRLRKIFTCTYRSDEEADWPAQVDVREQTLPVHMVLNNRGLLQRKGWTDRIDAALRDIWNKVIGDQVASARQVTIDEWWESRWAWAPSGSTSNRHLLKPINQADVRLAPSDRAGKKTVFEEMPDDAPFKILASTPIEIARPSTKPEPGGKQRALFASADESFIVASYASLNVEKFMNVDGIVGKQTPSDVAAWVVRSATARPCTWWLSLDYSAYNEGHEHRDMASVSWQAARAWARIGGVTPWAQQRALAAMWVACSHMNVWVSWPSGARRTFAGLFSGHRDTARDNSVLHGAYARIAEEDALKLDPALRINSRAFCGDDEDTEFDDWIGSLHYYIVHLMQGHALKPTKQAGGKTHEFLQRIFVPGQHPLRPLWSMLAQTASGNWYKDSNIWYSAAIPAVSDNCWQLHVRGMPLVWARRLAVETLNAMMRTPGEDGWTRLEWWKYRNGDKPHPLWYGLGADFEAPPDVMPKVVPHHDVSGNATAAWIRKQRRRFTLMDETKWEQYAAECMKDSYNRLYTRERLKLQTAAAAELWPARSSEIPVSDFTVGELPPMDPLVLYRLCAGQPGDRRPASMDEVASRFGIDARLLSLIGGFDRLLAQARPEMAAFYEHPAVPSLFDLRLYRTDDALTSWAKNTQAIAMMLPLGTTPKPRRGMEVLSADKVPVNVVDVYYAPNGAGKTTFARASNGRIIDADALLLEVSEWRELLRLARKVDRPQVSAQISAFIANEMVSRGATGMAWQAAPHTWLAPRAMRTFDVRITIVRPQRQLLMERLSQRGWSAEYIHKRLDEWDAGVTRIFTTPRLTSAERHNITIQDEFKA
jgi:hypothetical protein